jgi:hypothetical protein
VPVRRKWESIPERVPGNYTILLALMLAFILIPPFFEAKAEHNNIIISLLLSLVLLGTVKVFTRNRQQLIIGLALAIPALIGRWAIMITDNRALLIIFSVAWVLFLALAVTFIVHSVLTARRITYDTISGALCGYLLFGLMCSFVFALIEMFYPGSYQSSTITLKFSGHPGETHRQIMTFIYFSLVTLASVGFGDITPASPPARAVAAIEGIAGQFYIAVLIARLVSLHSSRWGSE